MLEPHEPLKLWRDFEEVELLFENVQDVLSTTH
jgi:hypothetical protein